MERASPDRTAEAPRTKDDVSLEFVRAWDQLPGKLSEEKVVRFLERALKPYDDDPDDIARGLHDALDPPEPKRGFLLLAFRAEELVGALVMLKTGMKGYVPENLLLFVAVDPGCRGMGIGGRLCRRAIGAVDGDVKLHVEYDNPAKRLYERLGFENKYAEMRWSA